MKHNWYGLRPFTSSRNLGRTGWMLSILFGFKILGRACRRLSVLVDNPLPPRPFLLYGINTSFSDPPPTAVRGVVSYFFRTATLISALPRRVTSRVRLAYCHRKAISQCYRATCYPLLPGWRSKLVCANKHELVQGKNMLYLRPAGMDIARSRWARR